MTDRESNGRPCTFGLLGEELSSDVGGERAYT